MQKPYQKGKSMQRKSIRLLLSLAITTSILSGCASDSPSPIEARTYYNVATNDYSYCNAESCPLPTQFTLDDEPDEPESPIFITPVTRVEIKKRTEKFAVNFTFSKSYLTKSAISKIRASIKHLHITKDEQIKVIGYTDNVEAVKHKSHFNQRLAHNRAEAVRNYLIHHYGFKASNITIEARPLCCYVASNKNKVGRYENRRAEIEVVITQN